jgi:hypothetical protein
MSWSKHLEIDQYIVINGFQTFNVDFSFYMKKKPCDYTYNHLCWWFDCHKKNHLYGFDFKNRLK